MYVVHNGSAALAQVLAQAHRLAPFREGAGGYVTIGVFDGVHRGHQQLVADMVKTAHSTHGVAIVLTFDPHPSVTLGYEPPPLLTTVEERAQLLAALGLDVLITLPFTRDTARVQAADFVEMLVCYLHLTELWGGPDFALGHRREGDIPFLQRLGTEYGFSVHIVGPLVWGEDWVSSSRVRAALRTGDVSLAASCLGRPYRLTGVATRSAGLYVSPPPERLIPMSGVYACLMHAERLGTHPAVVSITTRPTLVADGVPTDVGESVIEARLVDCGADPDDQVVALDFVARLRDEWTVSAPDALAAQVHDDVARARSILQP
jgi:riboflavin kinase/FMN adenylyltransferase